MSYEYEHEEEKPSDRSDLGGHRARKQKEAEAGFTNWRDSSRITDPDEIFKMFTELKFGKQKTNTTRKSSDNRVRTASMPTNEWIPGLYAAWSDDCDEKAIIDYNNKVIANYYNNKRRNQQQ